MQETKTETTRFWIGQQANPDDRRQIVVSLADAETIELSRRSRLHFAVTDLLTGHKLTLRRASCGAPRCMCALAIVREEKHKHDWETIRSYGATVGYDAKCRTCGQVAAFTPKD